MVVPTNGSTAAFSGSTGMVGEIIERSVNVQLRLANLRTPGWGLVPLASMEETHQGRRTPGFFVIDAAVIATWVAKNRR
jgi:hypothetical protein